jgi:hypothetical protein
MPAITTITITRQTEEYPFFYGSKFSVDAEGAELLASDGLLYSEKSYSADNLTLTLLLIYDSEAAEQTFHTAWITKYPTFLEDREKYCKECDHLLDVQKRYDD